MPSSPLAGTAGSSSFLAKSPSALSLGPEAADIRGRALGLGGAGNTPNDFITGYTLGLIGGVRSWVCFFIFLCFCFCFDHVVADAVKIDDEEQTGHT